MKSQILFYDLKLPILLLGNFLAVLTASNEQQQEMKGTNATNQSTDANNGVQLGVYLESLCPDSRRFVLGQLLPTYRQLGHIIDLNMVPFGHARVLGNNKMVCQHGPRECEGNRRFACIQSRAKSQLEQLETIACIFEANESDEDCLKSFMPAVSFEDLEKCTSSEESYRMMVEHEKETGRVGYVPHLTVNGKHDDEIQSEAEHNLREFVCKQYQGPAKPEACSRPADS